MIKESGIYRWFITAEGANKLGIPVGGCTMKEDTHYLIYIGSGKNLEQRLKYHIKGPKSNKGLKGSTYLQIDDRGKADLRTVLIAEGFKIDEYSPKTKFDKCWKYTSITNNDYDLSCEIKHGPFSDWYSPEGFYHLFVWVITF
jgi:hypothetical protein